METTINYQELDHMSNKVHEGNQLKTYHYEIVDSKAREDIEELNESLDETNTACDTNATLIGLCNTKITNLETRINQLETDVQPVDLSAYTTKLYVDNQLSKKSNTNHTHSQYTDTQDVQLICSSLFPNLVTEFPDGSIGKRIMYIGTNGEKFGNVFRFGNWVKVLITPDGETSFSLSIPRTKLFYTIINDRDSVPGSVLTKSDAGTIVGYVHWQDDSDIPENLTTASSKLKDSFDQLVDGDLKINVTITEIHTKWWKPELPYSYKIEYSINETNYYK